MISVNSNTILGVALDPSGRLAARKDRVDDRVFSYEFAYDAAGRLARVTRDGVPVEEYAYDAQGRRSEDTSSLRSVLGRLHEYDDLGRLRRAGNVEYTYDHADRLASRADGVRVTRYTYDREGRLKKVRLPNDHVIEYIHDPQGKRVARLRDGEVVERYYWLDFIRLLAVHDGRDREKVRFEYGEGRVPVAMRHKDMIYRIETDQVGSPLALVDRDDRVVKRIIYDSFGNVVSDDNPKLKIPLGFAGGLWDKETGLVHFGYRDYDPDVGRFTTKDPIGYAGGDNDLYGYGFDDPVNRVDPWGLESKENAGGPFGGVCGSYGRETWLPDKVAGNINLEPACSSHDACYGNITGPPKAECDEQFRKDLEQECQKHRGPITTGVCNMVGNIYYQGVDKLGQDAFDKARDAGGSSVVDGGQTKPLFIP